VIDFISHGLFAFAFYYKKIGAIVMENKKRPVRLELTLTNDEYEQLKERMESVQIKTVANYLRIMAFKGYIINLDMKAMLEPVKLMRNISSNINQIAVRVNSTDSLYAEDVAELEDNYSELSKSVSEIIGYISRLEE
jgi:hypothetical protein